MSIQTAKSSPHDFKDLFTIVVSDGQTNLENYAIFSLSLDFYE